MNVYLKFIKLFLVLTIGMLLLVGSGDTKEEKDDTVTSLTPTTTTTQPPVETGTGTGNETVTEPPVETEDERVNELPEADAGSDKLTVINEAVNLVGTGTDNDGTITSYSWKEGSTSLATTASFSYTATTNGEHTLTFTVTDNDGGRAEDTIIVDVRTAGSINGKITDYNTASGLNDVTISVNSIEVKSNAKGEYNLTNIYSDERVVVKIEKDGYAVTSKIAEVIENETTNNFNVSLLPIGITQEFDQSTDTNIQVPSSTAQVSISSNSLVLANGSLPEGSVTAHLTPIDPSLDINLMPGDMFTGSSSALAPIESYGAIIANFADAQNNKLNLANGATSTIRIPISSKGATIPDSIPLYYFDEEKGIWVEEGTATRNGDYYEGTVTHFSTWNADYLFDNITVTGCVEDTDGNKISRARIQLDGVDYNGQTYTHTNSNGEFSITAKSNAISVLVAKKSGKVSNTVKIGEQGETVTSYTMPNCLLFNNQSSGSGLSTRLTWGENPRDLDTHVIGPNGYHIYYANLGSLTSSSYLAQLDVDDITSFGPEVFTALDFPEAGTYHYSVHHFSGSSSTSASPARVELTVNGTVNTFVPPSVSNDVDQRWWNVFDIIVSENKSITIQPVNTFSGSSPSSKVAQFQKALQLPMKKNK